MIKKTTGIGILTCAFAVGLLLGSARPTEAKAKTCFRWYYPSHPACGIIFSGSVECRASPSVDTMGNEEARTYCRPSKGETCPCS